ncbi:unnamed protein product, partial [Durusdinium trenchii]
MAWCTVGYHAVEESIYEGLVEKDCSGVWLTQIKPMQWHHTPLAAISQTKKSTARKLGAALSNTLSGERGSGTKPGKSRSHVQAQVALAMERPNYIVFSLKTKENIADMCGKKILHPLPEGLGFEMTKPFDLFEPLLLPGEWPMTIQPTLLESGKGVWDGTAFWYSDASEYVPANSKLPLQAFSPRPKPFAYYIALPAADSGTPLQHALNTVRATPLLKLLILNEPSDAMRKHLFSFQEHPEGCQGFIPVTASPSTAMTLAFFAFKPDAENDFQSKQLQLHKLQTDSLPGGNAPHQHVLCSFWMVNSETIAKQIEEGKASLQTQSWQMTVSQTAEWKHHATTVIAHKKARLENRKRRLTDEASSLESDLQSLKMQLNVVSEQLIKIEKNETQDPFTPETEHDST